MRILENLETVFGRIVGRILWRAGAVAFAALTGLIALYHLTSAGIMALEVSEGALNARLIVGAIYLAIALVVIGVLWLTKKKSGSRSDDAKGLFAMARNEQIAMLVEAAMAGFVAGKKTPKSIP